jgi:tetratricopeptide (TPR) repeat protein
MLALCRADEQDEAAMALDGLGLIAKDQGDFVTALDYHQRAHALYASQGNAIGMARALTYASIAAYWQATYDRCFELAGEAIELQRGVGDVTSVAYSRDVQGMALVRMGRRAEGIAILEECVTAFHQMGDRSGSAMILADLGLVRHFQGNFQTAYEHFSEALVIARAIGDRRRVAFCWEGIAMALTRLAVLAAPTDEAALQRAVGLFAKADSLRREIDAPLPASERAEYDACLSQAAAHLSTGRYAEAWDRGIHQKQSDG